MRRAPHTVPFRPAIGDLLQYDPANSLHLGQSIAEAKIAPVRVLRGSFKASSYVIGFPFIVGSFEY